MARDGDGDGDGDDLVVVDWDEGDEPAAAAGGAAPAGWRRRVGPFVAMAAVALVVAAVALAGDDSPENEDGGEASRRQPATSTTATAATAPAGAELTTTTTVPFASEPTEGRRVLFLDGNDLRIVDVDGSSVSTRELPFESSPRRFDIDRSSIIVSGRDVFVSDGQKTVRLSTDLRPDERVVSVGDSLATVASARRGRVWLTQRRDDSFVVRETDADGDTTFGPKPLPVDWEPVGDVGTGLVLRRAGEIRVWDAASDRVVWESPSDVSFLGTAGTSVLWSRYCEGPFCAFHITDTRTGGERTFTLDGRAWQTIDPKATFAGHPSGSFAAASFTTSDPLHSAAAAIVDVRTGRYFSTSVTQLGIPIWSPDGSWLFLFSGDQGPEDLRAAVAVRVGRIEDGHLRHVTLHLPAQLSGTGVAVL